MFVDLLWFHRFAVDLSPEAAVASKSKLRVVHPTLSDTQIEKLHDFLIDRACLDNKIVARELVQELTNEVIISSKYL